MKPITEYSGYIGTITLIQRIMGEVEWKIFRDSTDRSRMRLWMYYISYISTAIISKIKGDKF